ncbi:GAF domain-containing protein [bacterium]|nr:GAF domain-containing protein [bacterium]
MEDYKKAILNYSDNPRINGLLNYIVTELKDFTEEQAGHITELSAIGKALSAQKDPSLALEKILAQARRFTNADGGTLYLENEDETELVFHVVHTESLNIFMGGTSGKEVTIPNVKIILEDGTKNMQNVSAYVANTNEIVNIPDVYEAEGFNFDGTKKFDKALNYRSKSMLVIPMTDHEDELIGVLQLINARDRISGETIPFTHETEEMVQSLASQAAVVLTQQKLIRDLKELFESFIRAIATAIDEKSRYTGGHISRVTELTMMLAHKLNEIDEGPFAEFQFTANEMEELRIAAWMHDTGKITTPEHVVDKSTKLETIFDRVELLKTRWQTIRTLKRMEAEKRKVEVLTSNGNSSEAKLQEIDKNLENDLAQLNDDLDFIVRMNTGGEFLQDEFLERIQSIGKLTYEENGKTYPYLTEDEIENLCIRKGTLTHDEREIINNHATMSIRILEKLTWPKKLVRVPEIAGAHHEKLDGTGYPNGLKELDLSLQARILAVADVFEALSAKDRPYKAPMPLSQAVKILGFMVKDRHLDGHIVDLFTSTNMHLEYAKKHLNPAQIDLELTSVEG